VTYVAYEQLSPEARHAVDAYWVDSDVDPRHVRREYMFEEGSVPVAEAKRLVMTDPDLRADFNGDFDAYHAWYTGFGDTPHHPTTHRWPVILDSRYGQDHEWIDDGSHRFHAYIDAGARTIPTLRLRRRTGGRARTRAPLRPAWTGRAR
jgi:hypothetical protein